jgi:hypothetical protein
MGNFGAEPYIEDIVINSRNNQIAQENNDEKNQREPKEMVRFQKWSIEKTFHRPWRYFGRFIGNNASNKDILKLMGKRPEIYT